MPRSSFCTCTTSLWYLGYIRLHICANTYDLCQSERSLQDSRQDWKDDNILLTWLSSPAEWHAAQTRLQHPGFRQWRCFPKGYKIVWITGPGCSSLRKKTSALISVSYPGTTYVKLQNHRCRINGYAWIVTSLNPTLQIYMTKMDICHMIRIENMSYEETSLWLSPLNDW